MISYILSRNEGMKGSFMWKAALFNTTFLQYVTWFPPPSSPKSTPPSAPSPPPTLLLLRFQDKHSCLSRCLRYHLQAHLKAPNMKAEVQRLDDHSGPLDQQLLTAGAQTPWTRQPKGHGKARVRLETSKFLLHLDLPSLSFVQVETPSDKLNTLTSYWTLDSSSFLHSCIVNMTKRVWVYTVNKTNPWE